MSPGTSVHLPVPAVTTVLLCPPEVPRQQQQPVTLTRASPVFGSLLVALAAPDAPRSTGACPALAMIPSPILVRTSTITALVKVPVDGCGFPQQAVAAALAEARAG